MRKVWIVIAAALIATPLTLAAFPAWAAACISGETFTLVSGPTTTAGTTTATYSAASCFVGPIDFTNLMVTTTSTGSGSVGLGSLSPFTLGAENGLTLSYTSNTGTTMNSSADLAWTYTASDNNAPPSGIDDAYASLAGNVTGTGTATVGETLSNGVVLTLLAPGSTSATFTPISPLGVIKDQDDFSGAMGSSMSSVLQNGFSVSAVPEPATWAMMLLGFVGLVFGLRQSRRRVSLA